MSGPNHVAGGLVYTGVFCSFFNVNIFSNPWYIVGTLFFALLPDIDHTKSPVGKAFAFTRLPNYIDVKYGHRTITHSIFIYLTLGVMIYLVESVVSLKHTFTLIYFLAYSSHLVFDMMTVSGVPLLYPWKKNPFVIPGNPDYRLRVKDIKSESIVFALFLGVFLFCIPLFENGFWTTYNRQFGTLDHLFREYSSSKDLLEVEYDFLKHGEQHKGKGILLHAEKTKAYILADSSVVEINDKAKINALLPAHTQQPRKEQEHFFLNISYDSLRTVMRNKAILQAEFQSSDPVEYSSHEHYKTGKVVKMEYDYNPFMNLNSDTLKAEILRKIEIKRIELAEIKTKEYEDKMKYKMLEDEIQQINRDYDAMTMADQEKAVPRLKELENKRRNYQFKEYHKDKVLKQLEHLNEQLAEGTLTTFSGKLVSLILL